jgi:pseudouridine-5'-phosphate glycosidase
VHRGGHESFDISADLQELARTPVAVVCAGAKSILDLGLTLEYLETHGVPVLSVGQDNFAAFFTPDSGLRADFRMDDADEQARFIRAKWTLGLSGGVVVSALPARAHQGADRRPQPGHQHRPGEAQRRGRCAAGACAEELRTKTRKPDRASNLRAKRAG